MSAAAFASGNPRVRARYMQSFLHETSRLPADDRRAIERALSPGTVDAIILAPLLGWLPFSVNLEFTRALAVHLGAKRTDGFFRSFLVGVTDTPLLHGFVRGALRVSFGDPGMYLPWIGKGWELLFRDCGRMTTANRRGPAGAFLELHGAPREALTDRYWVDSIASSVSGLAQLLRLEASVVASEVDARSGFALFSGTALAAARATAR